MRYVIIIFALVCFAGDQAPRAPQAPVLLRETVPLPEGAVKYKEETKTQSIFVLDNRDVIEIVPISRLEKKWHQSGGMEGVEGVVSDKYKTLPSKPKQYVANIAVKNSFNSYQDNRGIKREYADGSRFDDVLSYRGVVFEHRMREKRGGKWSSKVVYSDDDARPKGYTGLTATCASCHEQAGTGGYAVGLVPGGDTVLSDPVDWSLTRGRER